MILLTDILTRMWEDLGGRIGGPMWLRLVVQPGVAIVLAWLSGRADVKAGRPPYFGGMLTEPAHRRDMLRDGWRAIARVFLLVVAIDFIYQYIVFRWIYPGEALIMALLLACVPYIVVRSLTNRVMRLSKTRKAEQP